MKFRFCGDQDCPDWFLTQIATLSRLSSVKAKLLSQHVARRLMGQDLDMGKINSLLADSKLSPSEVQCLLSALEFVLSSASRFVTGEDHLRAELQQVGLPKETAAAVAKVHLESTSAIRDKLVDSSLRLNRLEDVRWRLASDGANPSPLIELDLIIAKNGPSTESRTVLLDAEPAKLQVLLYELERVRDLMNKHGLASSNQSH